MAILRATREVLLAGPADITTVYTPATGYDGWVDGFSLCNTSGAAADVELWRGGTTAAGSILSAKQIVAGDTYLAKEILGQWIKDGATVYARATVNAVVACVMSAREFPIPES